MPFQWLPESEGRVICIKADGVLTDADYREFLPRIEVVISEHGRIRLLCDLEDFKGWEPGAAWDDFTFGMTHWNHFDRIALIGDKAWESIGARIFDLLMGGSTRFFPLDERAAAQAWVREP